MQYVDFQRCAVRQTLALLTGKWKCVVLYHLSPGESRFTELWRVIPRISKKVLLEQLRELEADGLLRRREREGFPPEVYYALTERGLSLIPLLRQVEVWGMDQLPNVQPLS